jgi:hypothetical protein
MPQVFIKESDVGNLGQEDVPFLALYDDFVEVVGSGHGQEHVNAHNIWVPSMQYIDMDQKILKKEWRGTINDTIDAEADYRIEKAFPATEQQRGGLALQFDQATEAQRQELERGFNFIAATHAAATNLKATNPANPVDDIYWPVLEPPLTFW